MKKYHIALAADDAYLPYMYVTCVSIIQHLPSDYEYEIAILYLGSEMEHVESVVSDLQTERIEVKVYPLKNVIPETLWVDRHISLAAYSRLYLPAILPSVDVVFYFDCDTIVDSDLSELLQLDMGEKYVGACLDMNYDLEPAMRSKSECDLYEEYFNSGVMVLNLNVIRKEAVDKKFIECAVLNNNVMHDQTVLNKCCQGKIQVLDEKWNFCLHNWMQNPIISAESRRRAAQMVQTHSYAVIHYCSARKPWKGDSVSPLVPIWWKYAKETPYYDELCKCSKCRIDWKSTLLKVWRNPSLIWACMDWFFHAYLPGKFRK